MGFVELDWFVKYLGVVRLLIGYVLDCFYCVGSFDLVGGDDIGGVV